MGHSDESMAAIKNLQVRIPRELHHRVSLAVLKTRVPSLQELLRVLLENWVESVENDDLSGNVSQDSALTVQHHSRFPEALFSARITLSGGETSGEEATALWLEVLRRILASGHPVATTAITHNLHAFYELAVKSEAKGRGPNDKSSEIPPPHAAENRPGNHKRNKVA